MFTDMETWAEVRRRVLAGEISKREACREYGLHWSPLHEPPPVLPPRACHDADAHVDSTRRRIKVSAGEFFAAPTNPSSRAVEPCCFGRLAVIVRES